MISLYRKDPETGWHYREAWYDDSAGEFVVHHGALGTNGTVTAEKVAGEEAETLLNSFTAQCRDDGFAEVGVDELTELTVAYPLKGSEPGAAEQRNTNSVHHAVLTALAWRGLGALSDPVLESYNGGHAMLMRAGTLHRRKAADAAAQAVRGTDVPLSKVEIG